MIGWTEIVIEVMIGWVKGEIEVTNG